MFFDLVSVFITVAVFYKIISCFVHKQLKARLTAMGDLPLLGISRKKGEKIRGTAIICGGSIAGLMTARVCSDHFEKVTIIEAEEWITTPVGLQDYRDRAPDKFKRSHIHQYTSIHVFQIFFALALRKLFPTLEREVRRTNANFRPFLVSGCWSGHPIIAPFHQFTHGLPTTILQTRPVFEAMLRRLVTEACSNLEYIPGTVTGLVRENNSTRIVSVTMRSPTGEETSIPATLVVDCTGPAQGGLRWLQNLSSQTDTTQAPRINDGLPLSSLISTYNPKMAYTTTEFDVPPRLFPTLKEIGFPGEYDLEGELYANFPNPALESKNYAILRRERNYLQISCGGWNVKEQMTSVDDIRRFISEVKSEAPPPGWIFSMLDLFQEETIPVTFSHHRCPPSTYIAYHRAKNLPSNFIAIGDSVLRLNPIKGQGCTKACVEAVTLNAILAKIKLSNDPPLPETFGSNFFSAQENRTGHLWDIYRFQDYAWKSTIPAKGEDVNTTGAVMRAYEARFTRLMLKDREVSAVFWHIFNWLAPPTDIFSPIILLKIGWIWIRVFLGFGSS